MCCFQSACSLDEQYYKSCAISLMTGRRSETVDDLRMDNGASASSSTSSFLSTFSDGRCSDQDRINFQMGGVSHDSRVTNGITELLGLLRILGEGYRLSCLYRSQVISSIIRYDISPLVYLLICLVNSNLSRMRWMYI